MFRHRTGIAFSCALMAALFAPPVPPAAAAPAPAAPAPPSPVVNSWAVSPSGPNAGEPGSRPNLSYDLAPGAKVDDAVTLFNYGNTQLVFHVYATDAFNDATGGFDLLTGEKQPTDVGSWVKLPQANITVAASTRVDLPFKLIVPPDARPGDHSAAILASSTVNGHESSGKIVALDRRAGTRLYLRVKGALQPTLTVEKVHTTYHAAVNPLDGSLDIRYTVHNTGNVRLGAHQRLEVKSPLGKKMKQASMKDLVEVLPGNAVTMSVHFNHVTAAVLLASPIVVTPFPVGQAKGPANPAVARSGHAWAIPWSVLLVATAVCLAWQVQKRYRAGRRPLPPPSTPAISYEPVAT